jgi:pimeloyl-ACP methyl ester carboxylesterase
MNGGIYSPEAELSGAQKYLTLPVIGSVLTRLVSPRRFASLMGDAKTKVYSSGLTPEEIENLASILAYQSGLTVFSETLRYLDERRTHEVDWLEAVGRSDVPTTLIWGEQDPIAKTAIADHVWKNYLRGRSASAVYWRIPCASHYPQQDQPGIIVRLVRQALTGTTSAELSSSAGECDPVRVD